MTTSDMVNAFGAEGDIPSDGNLANLHETAWDLFNTYGNTPNTGPLAQTALTTLQAAFAATNQLLARTTAPGPL